MSDTLALARRAVACKHWRWMPGMLTSAKDRVLSVIGDQFELDTIQAWLEEGSPIYARAEHMGFDFGGCLPDLTDPATIGCLLALVREAVGDPCAHIVCVRDLDGDFWFVARTNWRTTREQNITGRYHRSEAEALVAALEAANV